MCGSGGFKCTDAVILTVAFQAELGNSTRLQQTRVRRTMWRVTSNTAFGFYRSMFVGEWSLFIRVALDASRIGAGSQSCLFGFKTTVGVVAVTAKHCTLEHLVVEGLIKLVLGLAVALHTQLRFALHQHLFSSESRLFPVWRSYEHI